MFDSLNIKLEKAFQTLKGQGRITEINVAATIKEIRKALIDADVNYKVAKDVTDEIKEKALGQNVLTSISPGQLLTKITSDELTELMGGQSEDIKIDGNPAIILIAGLQGSGKTTFSGKLANYLKRQGRQVLLAACDVYRPAAIDQLKILGGQIGVDVFADTESKDVVAIAKRAIDHAKTNNFRIVIVDTAGRLAVDEAMMDEIAAR
jgi:signal recognition particle subunit SRP54